MWEIADVSLYCWLANEICIIRFVFSICVNINEVLFKFHFLLRLDLRIVLNFLLEFESQVIIYALLSRNGEIICLLFPTKCWSLRINEKNDLKSQRKCFWISFMLLVGSVWKLSHLNCCKGAILNNFYMVLSKNNG